MFMRFKPFTGPRRWDFKCPDTGMEFNAPTKEELVKKIVSYRSINELPQIERMDLVIDNYLCSQPINCGACEPTTLHRSLRSFIQGGIALLRNMYFGDANCVDQATADSRANICRKCPLNVFLDKGPFVAWTDDIAEASIGDRKSIHYNELGNCDACSCVLKAKVWFKGPFKLTENERRAMADGNPNCWQLKEK